MVERLYRIRVVAELVGVSEPLLRTWERRYGLLEPRRTAGGYRAYTATDVAVLRRVKELTEQGVAIGEAARLAPQLRRELTEAASAPAAPTPTPHPDASDDAAAARWRHALVGGALAHDQRRVDAALDQAFAARSPLWVLDRVLMPAQLDIGERRQRGEVSIAGEHLVTQAVRRRLGALLLDSPDQ